MTNVSIPTYRYLFNFAGSRTGGGLKRLREYSRAFDNRGGAWFIGHPSCESLADEFKKNRYFFPSYSQWQRIFRDCRYLPEIVSTIGRPALYYSYGIPLYQSIGHINWFHLSNVLALNTAKIPLDLGLRLRMIYLGHQVRNGLQWADVISAESQFALDLFPRECAERLFLSVNGSDDELLSLQRSVHEMPDPTLVTMVGTHVYKGLDDGLRIFEMLRDQVPDLRLEIFGDARAVPSVVRRSSNVILRGIQSQATVVNALMKSRYYISMTHVENSWNAASEGIFLANESFLSAIPPHRELLKSLPVKEVQISGVKRTVLKVTRAELSGVNLVDWETVVDRMIGEVHRRNNHQKF